MLTWKDVLARAQGANPPAPRRVERSDAEWRTRLTPEQYHVTRQHGTERAFSSDMCSRFEPGRYACVCCGTLLFDGTSKFESGTGWPSFFRPIEGHVETKRDFKLFLPRTEYHCARCGGHQGHVFSDGPAPTGQRYCNNGVALMFVPEGEPLPDPV